MAVAQVSAARAAMTIRLRRKDPAIGRQSLRGVFAGGKKGPAPLPKSGEGEPDGLLSCKSKRFAGETRAVGEGELAGFDRGAVLVRAALARRVDHVPGLDGRAVHGVGERVLEHH